MTSDRFNQAQQLVAQGLFNEALILLKSIEQANINNPNYWFFTGICHASLSQFTDASHDFKKTLKLFHSEVAIGLEPDSGTEKIGMTKKFLY